MNFYNDLVDNVVDIIAGLVNLAILVSIFSLLFARDWTGAGVWFIAYLVHGHEVFESKQGRS